MEKATLSRYDMNDRGLGDPFSYASASRDQDLVTLVGAALDAGRARLAFQPIIRAEADGSVAFYEGLIRLCDAKGRVIPAGHFMPLVEETVLGRRIDCATLRLALRALAIQPDLCLSINVSARSLGDGEWRRTLDQGLAGRFNIGPRLILEINETSAMLLAESVIRFMHEMQPRGVSFALDGFGAGFTAFRHLKDFFFDLVKIDKGFVRGIDADADNQVLAEALITVAHQFEMFAVADGVETIGEAGFLRKIGVDCLQGYLFGVPTFASEGDALDA
ncbi:EAL domain-containing protein [Yoonia litorea]|uniref:EAL domain, c-di-GMP-specific phosphodiesterase class I (Or its enzymatically inactive variant) n=1 Tax=Yoonia litorea TaxID=1123755 RepID=A0A1I6N2S0_9RHOB|nr:EAL domain-containing protein [Yoonia litorea]SFS22194.1 EAL domain, c-di-GMP-specific phosphodiesterase class I (or its enzymatically inactive variant) [Yoonia litorea]